MTDTKTSYARHGDVMVRIRTEVATCPALIPFEAIVDACEIEPDDDMGQPWREHDGWEHDTKSPDEFEFADLEKMRGYAWDAANRERVVIVPKIDLPDFDHYHARGCSKQVARELAALRRREALDQLVDWYESQDWEWWGVVCTFLGEKDSVWGIDDYEYARDECREAVADEVAHKLEKRGFTVVRPPRLAADDRALRRRGRLAHWKYLKESLVVRGR